VEEITTRTLQAQGMSPARAYAALRAKAPTRSSYLLEMTEPDERGEQRSVIGFLVKQEAAYPAACDAIAEIAAGASAMPPASAQGDVGEACCFDVLSVVLFDAALAGHGLPPWTDLAFVGREIRQLSSVVFDHVAGTITITATNPNVVERIARVLAEAPELPPLPPAAGTDLENVFEQPPEAAFAKQLARAERRLASGGPSRLRLGRRFSAPMRGADPFDVMRALRETAPGRHVFFVEHAVSPMFPAYVVTGVARSAVRLDASAGAAALSKELLALFPVEELCGSPAREALSVWRDIAAGGLGVRGSLIVRTRPGGVVEALAPHAMVTFEEEQIHTHGVADVVPGRDARAHTAAASDHARAELAAIRRAHDAAEARQAAAPATSD
jgi:anthranilate synthase component 1